MRAMIAQDIDRTGNYLKERRIGIYGRLKRIPCAVHRQARTRAIHEKSGLARRKPDRITALHLFPPRIKQCSIAR